MSQGMLRTGLSFALALFSLSAAAETATFAGGCFWCMEPPFEKQEGVSAVVSGYTGGRKADPTYGEVSAGGTGHTEAVEIQFDPAKVSYSKLLEIFWKNIDPTDSGGQFCDRGEQYRSAIFYHSEAQKKFAEASSGASGDALKKKIVTEITGATKFHPAEDYHQDYYKKNPLRYKYYRYRCGRDKRLEELWGGRK